MTALEIAPEGTGFRFKTRFARFYNLPELMNLWKEATDIQTADMVKTSCSRSRIYYSADRTQSNTKRYGERIGKKGRQSKK